MITYCEACKAEIVAEDIVVSCEGLCEEQRYFHAKCVGLSYDEGCSCLHRNIFWMCDQCRDQIERARFRKSFLDKNCGEYATRDEVDSLKSEVKRVNAIVSQMLCNSATLPEQSTVQSPIAGISASCSPLTSTKITAGDHTVPSESETNFQLYVTNIAPDVTESEVKDMVCKTIGTTNVVHVKCLVSPWRDRSTLNYISFKVTIDAQLRESALSVSKWPSGVRCREFRDCSSSVWRPSTRTTQLST